MAPLQPSTGSLPSRPHTRGGAREGPRRACAAQQWPGRARARRARAAGGKGGGDPAAQPDLIERAVGWLFPKALSDPGSRALHRGPLAGAARCGGVVLQLAPRTRTPPGRSPCPPPLTAGGCAAPMGMKRIDFESLPDQRVETERQAALLPGARGLGRRT